ncbi:MAG: catalase family peroxidase [Actinomycetota bacterium]|nr:catalase family peroxidase [Actinomycetota bacterium]
MITPEQVVDGVNERYGRHPGYRTLHAKGFFCRARFTSTPDAARLTRAAHMQGDPVDATVRLSNGSGDPKSRDYVPDVRGMATQFHLPDGSRTDLSAQTAPNFPVKTPEGFVEAVQANVSGVARAWKIPLFLAKHPSAIPGLKANLEALKPRPSFANYRYFAIHAFKWVNADGAAQYVRYTWIPEAGEETISAAEGKERGPDYLHDEMRERLAGGTARFTLQLQLADPADPTDDPTANWPDERRTVTAGTLELTEAIPSPEGNGHIDVFDPMRLTDGIEPSDDPILRYRPRAYDVSARRRMAGS